MAKIQSLSKQASKQVEIIGCMDNTMDNTFESANRVYDTDGLSPTINTCGGGGLQPKIVEVQKVDVNELGFIKQQPTMIVDAQSLRMVRTEEGKKIRKAYESGEVHHGFNEFRTAEPREDGISNTITTVLKDNMILEQQIVAYDEQNKCIRDDVFGTLTTDGSSPKHNNRVIESKKIKIRQATKDGFVDCEIGGGWWIWNIHHRKHAEEE